MLIKTSSGLLVPAEAKTLELDPKYQPWKITLYVIDDAKSDTPRPVTYFVRCPPPGDKAAGLCERLWTRWEKNEKGFAGQKFPDIRGSAWATALDEGDWKDYLKSAIKYGKEKDLQIIFVGELENPNVWTVPGLTFDSDRDKEELPQQNRFVDEDMRGGMVSDHG